MDLKEIDKNFAVNGTLPDDVEWHSSLDKPITLYGVFPDGNDLLRLPRDVIKALPHLEGLAMSPAGGRLRFKTDSPYIAIRAYCAWTTAMSHMTLALQAGFDCYENRDMSSRYLCTVFPPPELKSGRYASFGTLNIKGLTDITVNLPPYGPISQIEIGIKKGCKLEETDGYIDKKPIVFYGSSITEGGCASRPGLTYEDHISRRFNIDYINLGLSGCGKAEDVMTDYLASLDCSVFVSDYDHNAPTPEYLRDTHYRMYEKIRAAHPDIPYIMISLPNFENHPEVSEARRDVIIESYNRAKKNDKNVFFIDGASLFNGYNRGDCTVDGCHPNDIGMLRIGEALIGHMQWML